MSLSTEAAERVEAASPAGGAADPAATPAPARRPALKVVRDIVLDRSRDALLTDFGKKTLEDRYLLPGESFQDMFARVARTYGDDADHAQRIYDYISKLWFMPATPILSNGGANRGLPISCFLNAVGDSLEEIVGVWNENVALASNGGGIGTYWGGVRSIGEKVKGAGQTSGIIPFIRVMDSLTLAISQGSLRRGSAAVYLDIHHPEIEEFLEIRKPSGDFNRKSLNLHHGVNVTDEFMTAVLQDAEFALRSPKTGETLRAVSARKLWQKILETRLATGEPYLVFSDTVNRQMAKHQRDLGLKVSTSNLCSEIMLHTGPDHLGEDRTAVCCLSSINAEKYFEWKDEPLFVEDVMRFLDNVLEDFIRRAPASMAKAVYSARRERSVGLGLMGFHSFLQQQGVPFESAMAKAWNIRLFKHIRMGADAASVKLAEERGACPDAAERGVKQRFSHKLAIAPTASISIICGGCSPCIEPIPANVYVHKTLSGSFTVKNAALEKLLAEKGHDTDETWASIIEHEGSVQHLDCLTDEEKAVFKTAFEIDQRWVIELAADRAPLVCQGQSVNVFLPGDIDKWDLHMLHWTAWEKGVKSLYYCRSKSVQRASYAGGRKGEAGAAALDRAEARAAEAAAAPGDDAPDMQTLMQAAARTDYDECLACQ
ncbi:ribonucleoside-diphosphate reductase subunit alpha [Amphiplicatus metriothermophilus]|uniref:Ribonucleoside-diphosphate reductase n=1 Tax=Amphiplicatus metriothermophilus TaxID=1519374 RepID=A0A239PW26_9PROT|nr:ribonucleoside-diphosphate reductase subunit alpha [Amphiplicatus metriothermophilus]MBB5518941.1 ribonucleoside-diphosphate reductase alpha chain [Amphiplicatus metriothermophilus]SNT74511.1 ribonucleoside-diphosphate reductase alpha chain [Amphiplicatus metriothermophilus]